MHPGSFVTAFVWGVIPAVVLLLIVYWLDRYEKEPLRLLALALSANFWAIIQTPDLGQSISPQLPGIMVAGFNHVFYGAVIGLFLAAARKGSLGRVLGAAVAGISVAAGFHLLHDYLPKWVS